MEKEKAEFDFGGNDLSADRGFASTSQQQNSNKSPPPRAHLGLFSRERIFFPPNKTEHPHAAST